MGILDAFWGYDYVVVPSGSCAGMLKAHLPHLFDDDPNSRGRADRLSERTFELTAFLVDVMAFVPSPWMPSGTFTYHDGCSGLRELGVKNQPRRLLRDAGVSLVEMAEPEICCGFGGTFCVKYPEISSRMVSDKLRDIVETGVDTVLAGDLGCLLNIAGGMTRVDKGVDARHVAEVLVEGGTNLPAIGGTGSK